MIGQKVLTSDGEGAVIAETPRLWIATLAGKYGVHYQWRFPKKGGEMREAKNERGHTRMVFLTATARDAFLQAEADRRWMQEHSWRIAQMVQHYRGDAAVLKEIARLVGYEEPAPVKSP